MSDRCPFCGNIQTLAHILSNCNVFLEQGRFTWRHDSVLSSIIDIIRPRLLDGFVLFSDMSGFQAPHGGTIPPNVLVTNLRPDLVLLNESLRVIIVFELTCPWDNNVERSHAYKEEKYSPLIADLSHHYTAYLFSVEVSVRGQITKANRARLKSFAFRSCGDAREATSLLLKNCSKASLLCSYSLFSARKEPAWASPPPLIAR